MNINTLKWDDSLLKFFNVPASTLPSIQASSSDFGTIKTGHLSGVKILGVVGDQQAALLGQGCVNKVIIMFLSDGFLYKLVIFIKYCKEVKTHYIVIGNL